MRDGAVGSRAGAFSGNAQINGRRLRMLSAMLRALYIFARCFDMNDDIFAFSR